MLRAFWYFPCSILLGFTFSIFWVMSNNRKSLCTQHYFPTVSYLSWNIWNISLRIWLLVSTWCCFSLTWSSLMCTQIWSKAFLNNVSTHDRHMLFYKSPSHYKLCQYKTPYPNTNKHEFHSLKKSLPFIWHCWNSDLWSFWYYYRRSWEHSIKPIG